MWRSGKWLLSSAIAVFAICSVVAYRGGSGNVALTRQTPAGYRFENLPATTSNSDELFVVLTFSGGGTRAAALAYGVLLELRQTRFTWKGKPTTLLDEVDVISSVSGGSFTAAYYGLHRERTFATFERDMLHRNVGRDLALAALRPDRALALPLTYYNRSDVAADLYDRSVFGHATFDQLARKGRPFVVINATDLSRGAPFEFTQNRFDLLCSDLSRFRVGAAVAASAGFPGLLTPLRMQNYAGQCGFTMPVTIENAQYDRLTNPHRYLKGNRLRSYLDARRRPYVHLVDGGVSDNLGLHTIIDGMNEDIPDVPVSNLIENGSIRKLIVIAVNAGTEEDDEIDRSPRTPGVATVIAKSAYAPIDNSSFQLLDFVRIGMNAFSEQVDVHLVHVNFESIPPRMNPGHYKTLPTNFNLPPARVNEVRDIGRFLLREDPSFRRFRSTLR